MEKAEGGTLVGGDQTLSLQGVPGVCGYVHGGGRGWKVVPSDQHSGSEKAGMGQPIGEWEGATGERPEGRTGLGLGQALGSGVRCLGEGIRVQVAASLGQVAASLGQEAAGSATGRWAAGGWPAYQPSVAGQPHQLPLPPPPSRWLRSCPACHSPALSAPPGPSGVDGRKRRQEGEGRRHAERGLRFPC